MIKIENFTDDTYQRHVILFEESEIRLDLRYHPTIEQWTADVVYKDKGVYGLKLSVGVLHMRSRNLPLDFWVTANAGTGLDPFRRDDFSTGRCTLYMFETADMETVRDASVPL